MQRISRHQRVPNQIKSDVYDWNWRETVHKGLDLKYVYSVRNRTHIVETISLLDYTPETYEHKSRNIRFHFSEQDKGSYNCKELNSLKIS